MMKKLPTFKSQNDCYQFLLRNSQIDIKNDILLFRLFLF